MLYDDVHGWLGWPLSDQVFRPDSAGASVIADYAQKKIGGALRLAHPGVDIRVGIIAPDPNSDSTEAPLAVVCEFPRGARDVELDLAHRLTWNFSRTALLITLEPHRLIAWSCYQDPTLPESKRRVCELSALGKPGVIVTSQQREIRDLLHWVSLVTGRIQRERPEQFPADGRADALLLKNLRHVRKRLLESGLGQEARGKDFCHDLLARVIFTQFLFHRKDSNGDPFFSLRLMKRLHEDGILSRHHADLSSVLSNKKDTYALFWWMDDRFNGDLFPGSDGQSDEEREIAWRAERAAIKKEHLDILAELIAGNLDTADRQLTLWPQYSFDTIPLEFISSIYEEFLNEDRHADKAYYTPPHLVDYVLDSVLPWNDKNWNLQILDPCCGSGIFLVKAFQRLIYRWRRANNREPLVTDLRPILANNFVGVDRNPEAVRVACFSLYLTMADAIEPKHYVTREGSKVFPRLRGTRLLPEDFFDEQTEGFRTEEDAGRYHLIIGNAPWGDGSVRPPKAPKSNGTSRPERARSKPSLTKAQIWAEEHAWPVANFDIGPIFLGKAGALLHESGRIAMVQTASILYWRDGRAMELRRRLFSSFTFDEVTNLSAVRRDLFEDVVGPACVVVLSSRRPTPQTTLFYYTPKPTRIHVERGKKRLGDRSFVIEPQDVNTITHYEAAEEPSVWPLLALGGRRDLNLIRRLAGLPTLAKLHASKQVRVRMGLIPGDQKKKVVGLAGRRYFESTHFPPEVLFELDAESVSAREDIYVDSLHGVRDLDAFKTPQLLIKQSFSVQSGRFRAAIVKTHDPEWGVACKKTYLSVHDATPQALHIRDACVIYNSRFATYFLGLTSSRIGHYITETLTDELVTVPLPPTQTNISGLTSFADVDDEARKAFALTPADWYLIEDFLSYALPDALRKTPGPGRAPTSRKSRGVDMEMVIEPELVSYAETFLRVIKSTFGNAKAASATVFAELGNDRLPVRMVTIHLDGPFHSAVSVESIQADGLFDQLASFHSEVLSQRPRSSGGGLGFQRVAFFFHTSGGPQTRSMNLTVVKPDECRYWTRSMAMRDADQLTGSILKSAATEGSES